MTLRPIPTTSPPEKITAFAAFYVTIRDAIESRIVTNDFLNIIYDRWIFRERDAIRLGL